MNTAFIQSCQNFTSGYTVVLHLIYEFQTYYLDSRVASVLLWMRFVNFSSPSGTLILITVPTVHVLFCTDSNIYVHGFFFFQTCYFIKLTNTDIAQHWRNSTVQLQLDCISAACFVPHKNNKQLYNFIYRGFWYDSIRCELLHQTQPSLVSFMYGIIKWEQHSNKYDY